MRGLTVSSHEALLICSRPVILGRQSVVLPSDSFDSLVDHPVRGLFPAQYVLRRPTRVALASHSRSFEMPR